MQTKLTYGKLLNEKGELNQAGYAYSLVKEYNRNDIKANKMRIKEWDYYLIQGNRYNIALTIADNSYMGLISASIIDLETPCETTKTIMIPFTKGHTNLPSTSRFGDVELGKGKNRISFKNDGTVRIFDCFFENFDNNGTDFEAHFKVDRFPQDSMVIATPFEDDKRAFYYNQKIYGMRTEGTVKFGDLEIYYNPDQALTMMDWGRGVWTFDNIWIWGEGQGYINGDLFAFNIGYGFGDTSAASENMLFLNGIAHKLDRVIVNWGKDEHDKDDYTKPFIITSSDGRFEVKGTPIINRKAYTQVTFLLSDQNQVFSYLDGVVKLDDGTELKLEKFPCSIERVRNKW